VKITMGVTLAPELAEAIKESAERQGLSFDDWVVAAAELKFRADDEALLRVLRPVRGCTQGGRGMIALVLDAGALIAVDRGDREAVVISC
jgi:hypothetical protein